MLKPHFPLAKMTISEFQKKKINHVFKLFFDVDHNNIIDWRDFEVSPTRGAKG